MNLCNMTRVSLAPGGMAGLLYRGAHPRKSAAVPNDDSRSPRAAMRATVRVAAL